MNFPIINMIFSYFLGFVFFNKKLKIESIYVTKILSSINAIVLFLTSVLYLRNIVSNESFHNASQSYLGYLIYDIIIQFADEHMYKNLDKKIILHHILVFFGVYTYYVRYPYLLAISLLSEVVNPFLYYTIYMYKNEMINTHSGIYKFFSRLTLFLYFVFRLCNFPFILVLLFLAKLYIPFIALLGLTVLNYFWFGKMVSIFLSDNYTYELVNNSFDPHVEIPVNIQVDAKYSMDAGKMIFKQIQSFLKTYDNYKFVIRNINTKFNHVIYAKYQQDGTITV